MEYKALAFLEEVAATIELSFDDTDGTLDVVMKNSDGEQVASGSVTVNAWKAPVIAATATVDGGTGTPSVEVVKSGTADNMTFTFKFHNLKGADGQDATPAELYWHTINMSGTAHDRSIDYKVTFSVLSTSSTPYSTMTKIKGLLSSCGFTSSTKVLPCNGVDGMDLSNPNNTDFIYGIFNDGDLKICEKKTSRKIDSVTATDTVVKLL